ncbi:hypothetical protein CASFOL_004477 [Castilleja foliolosa]|uniref:Uncharacterized protein n=1 Tax=Castilleja foliolosa TaxID=1961234 RepID=A0ABD3EEC1_9LAMI
MQGRRICRPARVLGTRKMCEPICTQQPVSGDIVPHESDAINKSGPVPTNKNVNGGAKTYIRTVKINHAQSSKSSQAAEKLVIGQSIQADEAFVNPPNKRAALVVLRMRSPTPLRKMLKVVRKRGPCQQRKIPSDQLNRLQHHNMVESAKYFKGKIKINQIGVDDVLSNEMTKILPKFC